MGLTSFNLVGVYYYHRVENVSGSKRSLPHERIDHPRGRWNLEETACYRAKTLPRSSGGTRKTQEEIGKHQGELHRIINR